MTRLKARFSPLLAALGAALLIHAGDGSPALAQQQPALDGAWSGGGTVTFPTGATERARCRANFRRSSAGGYLMDAVCATPSVRVTQSAELRRAGANQLSGSFFNPEYSVSGDISITVQGSRMTILLNGGGGSGRFNLSR